tara:strand:- start:107 stop:292 length:186 start_codon:yes stop_codon:yes gene_type:complete
MSKKHKRNMQFIFIIIVGVLIWQSPDARQITSDGLQGISDFIEPAKEEPKTIGEHIDSFLD